MQYTALHKFLSKHIHKPKTKDQSIQKHNGDLVYIPLSPSINSRWFSDHFSILEVNNVKSYDNTPLYPTPNSQLIKLKFVIDQLALTEHKLNRSTKHKSFNFYVSTVYNMPVTRYVLY